jgi:hypothetical protein
VGVPAHRHGCIYMHARSNHHSSDVIIACLGNVVLCPAFLSACCLPPYAQVQQQVQRPHAPHQDPSPSCG